MLFSHFNTCLLCQITTADFTLEPLQVSYSDYTQILMDDCEGGGGYFGKLRTVHCINGTGLVVCNTHGWANIEHM